MGIKDSATDPPFWRQKRARLAAEFEARRHLLDTALRFMAWACDNSEDRSNVVLLVAATELLRLYELHVRNEHATALDVIASYGSILESHAERVSTECSAASVRGAAASTSQDQRGGRRLSDVPR